MTTRARKAARGSACNDCGIRAESICGGCGKPICGSDACLAVHEHRRARKAPASPAARQIRAMAGESAVARLTAMLKNPHAGKAAQGGKGIDRRKIREMAERWLARYAPADARLLHLGDLVGFGALVARQVRLERRSVLVDLETGLIKRVPKTRRE